MDDIDKGILRRFRTKIVEQVDVRYVKDYLIQREIFSPEMWEAIDAGETPRDRISRLLDHLPKRGPRAFGSFCSALLASGYPELGNTLFLMKQQRTGQNGPIMMSHDARGYRDDVFSPIPVLQEALPGNGLYGIPAICAVSEDGGGESVSSSSRPPSRATISSGYESIACAESQRYVTEKQIKEVQQELIGLREKTDDVDRSMKGLHDKVDSLMLKSKKDKNLIRNEFQELHKEHRKLEGMGDINTALKHVEYTIETKCDGKNVEAIREVRSVVKNLSDELKHNLPASQISAHQFYESLCDKLIVQIIGKTTTAKDTRQRVESPKTAGQSCGKPSESGPRSHSVGSGNSRSKPHGEKHSPASAVYKKKERVTIV